MGKLIEFAFDDTKPPETQLRLRAIRDALDRGGLSHPRKLCCRRANPNPMRPCLTASVVLLLASFLVPLGATSQPALVEASQTPGLLLRLPNRTRETKPNRLATPSRGIRELKVPKASRVRLMRARQNALSLRTTPRHDRVDRTSATATDVLSHASCTSQARPPCAWRTRRTGPLERCPTSWH